MRLKAACPVLNGPASKLVMLSYGVFMAFVIFHVQKKIAAHHVTVAQMVVQI